MGKMAELVTDCWRVDHEPVPISKLNMQAYAAAKLIGHCEVIAESGILPVASEQALRVVIAEALIAFNMEPHK